MKPSIEAVLGTVIDGKYRLDSLIGLGGMGRVFCATHLQLNKTFALKLMNFPAHNSPQLVRFKREAESLAKIRHPNVVGVTDFGITTDHTPYIVMEYIEGMSLRTMMEDKGYLTERQALLITKQMCAGLYAAHLQGIVHRDLKPENIMIEQLADGEILVRVLDFSIAKLLQLGDNEEDISEHEELIGTIKYMTPEQFLGNAVDARSDIFGICMMIYEMLTGVVPAATVSLARPLKELRPDISPRLNEIVHKGLSPLAINRQQSALELKRELEGLEFITSPDLSTQYSLVGSKYGITTTEDGQFDSLELQAGQKISYYHILKKLAEGGMGEVYLAEDARLGRKVALKLLPKEITQDPKRTKRFEQEARTASALNHPNILTIYEIGDFEGIQFIATEYIEGLTLKQRIQQELSLKEILKIAVQIANALAVAHPAGVVHRDIKPGNIMIRADGYVKILDFGLAKFTEANENKDSVGVNTEAGKIMGTPKYMSPEQARGQFVDSRTDIFSFGVVLYEMITGKVPFDGATNTDIIVSVLEHEALPISQYVTEIDSELERIVQKALRKDKEERYQTVKDMLLDLKSLKQRLDFEKELNRNNTENTNPSGETTTSSNKDKTDKSLTAVETTINNNLIDKPKNKQKFLIPLIALVIIFIGTLTGYFVFYKNLQNSKKARSLAILPFRNLQNDPDTDFLSFSLADAVINKLGYVDSLTLRPSSAISKYRNQDIDIKEVASQLKVNTLLIGSFLKEGEELRINAQLVDVENDEVIWVGSLDLKYEKLLTVQTKVADRIVKELEIKLTDDEAQRLKRDIFINSLAYEYCLKGVDLMVKSANNFSEARSMLEKSVALDPNYAQTWAYLGFCYASAATAEYSGQEYYIKAQAAYDKAIELDSEQIDARVFSATLLTDTGKAEEAVNRLKEVIRKKPQHAPAYWELSYAYRYGGMLTESIKAGERAIELDTSVMNRTFNSYLYAGEYRKFLESLPNKNDSYFIFYKGLADYYLHNSASAKKHFDEAYRLTPDQIFAQIGKTFSLSIEGKNTEALELIKNSEEKIKSSGVSDGEAIYKIAQAYAVLEDKPSALAMLRLSIEKGFFCYPYFLQDILLDNLRKEKEFTELLEIARKRHEEFKKQSIS